MPEELVIKLELPSEMQLIYVLDSVVSEILKEMKFEEESAEQVNLAVIEAGTNAIRHGNKGDITKRAHFEFRIGEDRLTVKIRDEGDGFDPDDVADPLDPVNLLSTGGRGIFLIRVSMDEVCFADEGRELTMVKHKAAAEDCES